MSRATGERGAVGGTDRAARRHEPLRRRPPTGVLDLRQDTSLARLRTGKPPGVAHATGHARLLRQPARRQARSLQLQAQRRHARLDARPRQRRSARGDPARHLYGAGSPDGRRVAYQGGGRIWVQSLDGGEARPLTADHHDSDPLFTFDGRSVVFLRALDHDDFPFIVDVAGGEARPLGSRAGPRHVGVAGRAIAWRCSCSTRTTACAWRSATSAASRAASCAHVPPGSYQTVRISPDGKRLLLATQSELLETGLDGGPLVSHWKGGVEELSTVDYAPDGDGFIAEIQVPDGDLWLAEGTFR